ncbi:hypothetical protein [Streptomyces sp. NPDC046939]|uniref:hypothetical protein n=1 Tax=Streptomyces sp. NPDC046939 TaxID=3155376 RepID=UPI0034020F0E
MSEEPDREGLAPVPPEPSPEADASPPEPQAGSGGPDAADGAGETVAPDAARAGRAEQDEREGDDRGYDELRQVQHLVNNNFYGMVDASGAAFGFGGATSPGLAPGIIEPEDVDRALRFYETVRPCFDEALARLRENALVVLVGEDHCGRGAGALALLREVLGADARLRSLPPGNALADLAASRDLQRGHGYVIRDYVGELRVEAVQAYEISRLSAELRRHGSYLVITAGEATHRRLALRDHCVPWRAPDPLELFERCRAELPYRAVEPDVEQELLQRVTEQRRPKDIVAAALVLADEGPQEALNSLHDRHQDLVHHFFLQKPHADDLIPLTALAFLEGIPQRTFEKECAALTAHVRAWEQSGEAPVAERGDETAGVLGAVAQQSRARWKERATGLVTTEHRADKAGGAGRSERRLVFTSPRARELVIKELHDLYGYELWYPVRQWLGELSLQGDLATRTEVARGVALLARHALGEVDENMLRVWSEGLASQRVTAALTLQFMCDTADLAPHARNIAVDWTDNRGQGRAVTAAMAFTGRLGSLYRLEALNWLWFLTLRGERVALAAHRSLVLLLQSAEQDARRALFILRYVRTALARSPAKSRERSIALRTTVQLLEADSLDAPQPVAAALLRTVPDSARHLGSLWADALHSGHRSRAISALCRTLVQLRHEPAARGAVNELGESMRTAMSTQQWAALRRHLSIALRHPDYAIPGAHELAQVLLGSLRRPASAGAHRGAPPPRSAPRVTSAQGGRSK